MSSKKNLANAKKNKNDEFYTRREDIENEMKNYFDKFKGKSILCNCDDPNLFPVLGKKKSLKDFNNKKERIEFYNNHEDKVMLDEAASQFWVYFHKQFKFLGLKKLVATHYKDDGTKSFAIIYDGNGDDNNIYDFDLHEFKNSDGDFRSEECIELLKEANIVITNPPFSLFREYVAQLIEYEKNFLIIGNKNSPSYKEFFPLLKENKIWLGVSLPRGFIKADGTFNPIGAWWFTNLDLPKRHQDLIMVDEYKGNEYKYPKYDNYDAINVDKIKEIPRDWGGVIGVPISFLVKHNPDQFDIVGSMCSTTVDEYSKGYPYINGKKRYARILIKKKN
ncbi:MAG: adenine-specific methyltransferase EcoRI family protein [Mycoplasmoidaceae bacterium]